MTAASRIEFHFLEPASFLKHRHLLKDFILLLLKKEEKLVEHINYIFCSDTYLLQINRAYLKHNYFTDIISFDLSEADNLIADIYISVNRIRDNASRYKTSLQSEMLRVMLHGALHLAGYGDKTSFEKKRMIRKENHYLEKWFHVKRSSEKY